MQDKKRDYRIGIDIGGSFSDAVLLHDASGQVWTAKALTTADPTKGAIEAIERVVQEAQVTLEEVGSIVHATTLVPNTILQRRGTEVGFITNLGFEDLIHIGREARYDTLHLDAPLVEPLVARRNCRGVAGRMLADGTEIEPFDLDGLKRILEEWKGTGISAVAVCLMHCYANPAHEQAALAAIRSVLGDDFPVSLSSEVAPEIREFERASTTVLNAYVQPVVSGYLNRFETALADLRYKGQLLVMLSEGGVTSASVASKFPARMLESGPAAGVLAAAGYSSGDRNPALVAFDIGGTTAKACLVTEGRPQRTASLEVARTRRFAKGSGITVRLPSVDLIEIGAGGGSIAHTDFLGLLKVGPQSAESRPGPACFGMGGAKPTVTDANLVLGYFDAEGFAGGTMQLDLAAARDAIATLAKPLEASVEDAALAIVNSINESMADAIRVHLAEHGLDPRRATILASGGGGPLHAARVARKLSIGKVLVPANAAVLSAVGLLVTPPAIDLVRSHIIRLTPDADYDRLFRMLKEVEAEARATLADTGVPADAIRIERWADFRWVGQTHSVETPLPDCDTGSEFAQAAVENFNAECTRIYGAPLEPTVLESGNWRIRATVSQESPDIRAETVAGQAGEVPTRTLWFEGTGGVVGKVYQRAQLEPGFRAPGPAIVEDRMSTALIGPHDSLEVDDLGNLVISINHEDTSRGQNV
ncbi:hydantoinase/oxoprolinase family protein [Oceaniglobus trochenteri]|uniref:hydantoinase/oxoprolinase family protein n=1 Tax=Oceaniglobus trochenteri TaxID=2763260 RepID=UPI001CFFA021